MSKNFEKNIEQPNEDPVPLETTQDQNFGMDAKNKMGVVSLSIYFYYGIFKLYFNCSNYK